LRAKHDSGEGKINLINKQAITKPKLKILEIKLAWLSSMFIGAPKDFGTPVAKIDSPRGESIMP